jgi:hypothetical protein
MRQVVYEAPEIVRVHGVDVSRQNDMGGAYYRLDSWPFVFRVRSREMFWYWTVEGFGVEDRGSVSYDGDIGASLNVAVQEMLRAAGRRVRAVLGFSRYE